MQLGAHLASLGLWGGQTCPAQIEHRFEAVCGMWLVLGQLRFGVGDLAVEIAQFGLGDATNAL
jgi:hypothetical protein